MIRDTVRKTLRLYSARLVLDPQTLMRGTSNSTSSVSTGFTMKCIVSFIRGYEESTTSVYICNAYMTVSMWGFSELPRTVCIEYNENRRIEGTMVCFAATNLKHWIIGWWEKGYQRLLKFFHVYTLRCCGHLLISREVRTI